MSTFRRLMIMVLLVLLPSLVAQVGNEVWLYYDRTQELRRVAQASADVYNTELDQIVRGLQRLLGALAELPVIKSLEGSRCSETLETLAKQYPNDLVLAVADPRGAVICSSLSTPPSTSIGDREFFLEAKKGFTTGTYLVSRLDGKKALPFADPIVGVDGTLAGFAIAYLSLDWLGEDLQRPPLIEGQSLVVADREGKVLAALASEGLQPGTTLPSPMVAMMRGKGPGVAELNDLQGRPTIYGYVPITVRPRDIYLLFGITRSIAFAPIRDAMLRSAGLGLVSLVGAFLIAWVFGVRFVRRPVDRLLIAAQAWQEGNYQPRANLQAGAAELRNLGDTFDHMADVLGARDRQLAEALQFRDIIIAAAGHDLRQPLQRVMWALERLSLRPLTQVEIEEANRALDRLNDELDMLIDVARLPQSTTRVHHEPVTLGPLLEQVAQHWSSKMREKNLSLRVRSADATVISNQKLLAVILENLVGNAFKYTDRGGVLLSCRRCTGQLCIDVYDTGVGIPADKVETIFQQFRQLNPVKDGFGLGLWIALNAAQILGHTLSVRSRPGRGSRFRIIVPLDPSGEDYVVSRQRIKTRECAAQRERFQKRKGQLDSASFADSEPHSADMPRAPTAAN